MATFISLRPVRHVDPPMMTSPFFLRTGRDSPQSPQAIAAQRAFEFLLDSNIAKGKHMCSIRCMQRIVSKLNRDKLGVVIQPPLLCTMATLTLSIPFFHSAKLPVSSDSSNSAKPQSEVMMPSVGTCLFAGALAIWVTNLGPFSILLNQQ